MRIVIAKNAIFNQDRIIKAHFAVELNNINMYLVRRMQSIEFVIDIILWVEWNIAESWPNKWIDWVCVPWFSCPSQEVILHSISTNSYATITYFMGNYCKNFNRNEAKALISKQRKIDRTEKSLQCYIPISNQPAFTLNLHIWASLCGETEHTQKNHAYIHRNIPMPLHKNSP